MLDTDHNQCLSKAETRAAQLASYPQYEPCVDEFEALYNSMAGTTLQTGEKCANIQDYFSWIAKYWYP